MSSVTVKVGEDDIREGDRCSPGTCPISRAIKRMFPIDPRLGFVADCPLGGVSQEFVYWRGCEPELHPLPAKASHFVKQFDKGCKMQPFEFDLDVPDSVYAQMIPVAQSSQSG